MKNTLRNYRNTISLNFEKRGSDFTLDVPHYNNWMSIIRFLKKRGFTIKENPSYKEHFASLSKYHKIGFKKNLALLMEISSHSIIVEFGNVQNLWTGIAQSFWNDESDERFTRLTYLESVAVKLEIKKLWNFCRKYNHDLIKEDSLLSPEEYILSELPQA